jgi:signal transduction histidine kinase
MGGAVGTGGNGAGYAAMVSAISRGAERVRVGAVSHAGDLLVGVLVVAAVLERGVQGHSPVAAVMAGTWGLPLLARRHHPLLAPTATLLLIAATGFLLPGAVRSDTAMEFLLTLVAVWTVAARNPLRWAAWVLAAVALVIVSSATGPEDLAFSGLLILGAAVAGFVQRRTTTERVALDDHVAALELGRDAALREAAAAERARIARELHDIVGHSVSVMTVQAGAARLQLAIDPPQARASVAAVEEATGTALADLDRLLGLLGEQPGALRTLDDVDGLVRQVGGAGLDVRVHREGIARPLPGGLELALYRILQEALTNVLKHADGGIAEVALRYGDGEVGLRVTNPLRSGQRARSPRQPSGSPRQPAGSPRQPAGSPRQPAGSETAAGHGLIGMRERAELYGGRLLAGPRDGVFTVDVQVPVP